MAGLLAGHRLLKSLADAAAPAVTVFGLAVIRRWEGSGDGRAQ